LFGVKAHATMEEPKVEVCDPQIHIYGFYGLAAYYELELA